MNVAFYYPNQAAPSVQWKPSKAPRYPIAATSDYTGQVTGETAGGTVYVQDAGGFRQQWNLVFERLTPDDHSQLQVFFQTVQKAFHAFEYTDPSGALHTVRWVNAFEFEETVPDRFTGTVVLRKE